MHNPTPRCEDTVMGKKELALEVPLDKLASGCDKMSATDRVI